MAGRERKLTLILAGNASGAARAIDTLDRKSGSLSSKLGGLAKSAAIGFGALAAGAVVIGKGLIDAATESQKVTAQTSAVLKSMGDQAGVTASQVADLSTKLSLKSGVDDEVIQSAQNVLLTFGKVRNEVGKGNKVFDRASAAALDMSVALGTDMQGATIQIGKALNDPIKGITALSRAGVSFTEQQKDQIKTLVKSGKSLDAQKLILGELEKQFGGSAEAQATAADKLKVAWGNIQEQLGAKLLPIFEKVATWLASKLPGAVKTLERVLGPIAKKISAFFYTLTSGFTEDEGTPIERFALKVRDVLGKVRAFVEEWAPKVGAAIVAGLAAISGWWDEHGPKITAAVTGFAEDFKSYVLDPLSTVATFIVENVVPAFAAIVTWILENKGVLEAFGVLIGVTLATHYVRLAGAAVISSVQQIAAFVASQAQAIASAAVYVAQFAIMIGRWVALAASAVLNAAIVVASWISTNVAALGSTVAHGIAVATQTAAWSALATSAVGNAARIAAAWTAALGPAAAVIAAAETINHLVGSKKGDPNAGRGLLERLDPRNAFEGMSLDIPGIASGGIVKARPGGILANVGEGGYDEAVIPLDGRHGLGGGGNTYNLNVTVPPTSDPGAVGKAIVEMVTAYERRSGSGWRQ